METHSRHLKLGGILSQSLRLLGGKPLTFLGIGLIPAGLLWASFGAIVLGLDHAWRSGEIDLIATWRSLSPLVRAGFILSLLASLALVFRGYAASVLVTSEWRQGRSISTIRAYSQVRYSGSVFCAGFSPADLRSWPVHSCGSCLPRDFPWQCSRGW